MAHKKDEKRIVINVFSNNHFLMPESSDSTLITMVIILLAVLFSNPENTNLIFMSLIRVLLGF